MDRRFMAQSAMAALAASRLPPMTDKLGPIGIQLYTVRDLFSKDAEGTLAALGKLGYAEVEFAGYYGHSPAAVAAMLRRAGLTAPSAHVDHNAIKTRWQETLDQARTIGHRYLILAWLVPAERERLDQYRRLAEELNRAGAAAKAAGITLGYHNHDFEFHRLGGEVPYDVLLAATDPSLIKLELDLYWATKAGADPLGYFARWPGRFPLVHVKDMGRGSDGAMVDLGTGRIEFGKIFARRKAAGIEHFIVEHDQPKDPLAFARSGLEYLRRLEF
jgi:sugar phosphate isomerase/epimerase